MREVCVAAKNRRSVFVVTGDHAGFFFGERGKGEKSPSPCCEKERLNAVYLCSKRTFVNIDQQERLKVRKAADKRADITYLWNNNASITAFYKNVSEERSEIMIRHLLYKSLHDQFAHIHFDRLLLEHVYKRKELILKETRKQIHNISKRDNWLGAYTNAMLHNPRCSSQKVSYSYYPIKNSVSTA